MSRKTLSDNNVTSEKFAWPGTSLLSSVKLSLKHRTWLQARIHTGFYRFTEIGQIFHNKYIFIKKF